MRYIIGSIRMLLLVIFSVFTYWFYLFLLLFIKHNERRGFILRRSYLYGAFLILGIRIEKKGHFAGGPVLFVVNHKGLLDFFISTRYVHSYILSKAEMEHFPILGPASKFTGVIFVKRKNKESRGAARRAIAENLKKGRNVMVYPEGTTYDGQTTKDFYPGSFEVASQIGVPVVPVALEYRSPRDYFNDNSIVKVFYRAYGKLFTHCKISFGPPISNPDAGVLLKEAKDWIDSELLNMQKDWSKVKF